ncbi:MAG: FadR family transcriptional regulator [Lachnospiraceae bacterium]|nr:FadR family transcriptional regulator [Lachnospiraceae bacterium]
MEGKAASLVESVADDIIRLILENQMKPGDRLPNEHALAELLRVGRSTVREAVKTLRSRNILETRQGSGTYVSSKQGVPIDPLGLTLLGTGDEVARDLMDVRLILEPEIAAMAAVRATEEEIDRMSRQCGAVEELIRNQEDYGEADALLHRYIAEASGNVIVGVLIPIIMSSVSMCIQITGDEYRDFSIEWHRFIVESIRGRDPQGARWAMVNHLSTNRQGILCRMKKPPEMDKKASDNF